MPPLRGLPSRCDGYPGFASLTLGYYYAAATRLTRLSPEARTCTHDTLLLDVNIAGENTSGSFQSENSSPKARNAFVEAFAYTYNHSQMCSFFGARYR